jgi:hypothetical protein
MKIVSEYCSYSEEGMKKILSDIIKKYTDETTGLKLNLSNIKVNIIA